MSSRPCPKDTDAGKLANSGNAVTAFEKSQAGQHAYSLPKGWKELDEYQPVDKYKRKTSLPLPEISEIDLTRHFAKLAARNMGIDNNFYPLGSCTMKLNPRVNEVCASLPGFSQAHPLADDSLVQGCLELMADLIHRLCEICGMDSGTVIPNAGAQGEFTGIRMIAEFHKKNGDCQRNEILIPDDAHGTNPATASMAGFKTIPLRTSVTGDIDLAYLQSVISNRTAGLMLTNPNTLGLFSPAILETARIVHDAGGLLYYDGANLNPILNIAKPGEMGFDVMHINLHKTFSTPHGGGGPGSGPVLCKAILEEFLPVPRVEQKEGQFYRKDSSKNTIGRIASFQGNFGIYLRAYVYALLHGNYGLRKIAEGAVLNANYLKKKLEALFKVPYPQHCMHEFVVQADSYIDQGIRALDIAKRLLDYGVHAPTIYFPLIIKESMLIEPTESESKRTLDEFISIVERIVKEIHETPDVVKTAPHDKPVGRLDEVRAARIPILKHATL